MLTPWPRSGLAGSLFDIVCCTPAGLQSEAVEVQQNDTVDNAQTAVKDLLQRLSVADSTERLSAVTDTVAFVKSADAATLQVTVEPASANVFSAAVQAT